MHDSKANNDEENFKHHLISQGLFIGIRLIARDHSRVILDEVPSEFNGPFLRCHNPRGGEKCK